MRLSGQVPRSAAHHPLPDEATKLGPQQHRTSYGPGGEKGEGGREQPKAPKADGPALPTPVCCRRPHADAFWKSRARPGAFSWAPADDPWRAETAAGREPPACRGPWAWDEAPEKATVPPQPGALGCEAATGPWAPPIGFPQPCALPVLFSSPLFPCEPGNVSREISAPVGERPDMRARIPEKRGRPIRSRKRCFSRLSAKGSSGGT